VRCRIVSEAASDQQVDQRFEQVDQRLEHISGELTKMATKRELELWGGALMARIEQSEKRLLMELARHTQANHEASIRLLAAIDDRGLPPGGSAAEGRRGVIDDKQVRRSARTGEPARGRSVPARGPLTARKRRARRCGRAAVYAAGNRPMP